MRNPLIFRTAGLVAALLTGLAAPPALAQDAAVCDAAGELAERQFEVPAGLLRAIGRVESGRRDPLTGRTSAWPWTINAEGRGQYFSSRAEAVAAVDALQRGGTASIDVGCYQVNLVHHPAAFPSPAEGFEPASNAAYAARFLAGLKARTGSWEAAVAAYHSATPERGGPYRDRVLAGWSRDGAPLPAAAAAPAVPPVAVVRVVTWSAAPATGGMRIWTPSANGQGALSSGSPAGDFRVTARAFRRQSCVRGSVCRCRDGHVELTFVDVNKCWGFGDISRRFPIGKGAINFVGSLGTQTMTTDEVITGPCVEL